MSEVKNWREALDGYRMYSLDDVRQVQEEAGRLQAEMVSKHLGWIGRGIWSAIKWVAVGTFRLFASIYEGVAAMRLYEELNGLSDSELEKLGVARGNLTRYVFLALGTSARSRGLYAIDGDLPAAETVIPSTVVPSRRAA